MRKIDKSKLRFKEFQNNLNIKKLKELATFHKGRGYSKKDIKSSGKPIILYGSMYTNYKTHINEAPKTFVDGGNNDVTSEKGDVIVPASGETPLDIARASCVNLNGIILGGDLNIIRTKKEINGNFLSLYISNGKRKLRLADLAQGKSVVHIHNSDLMTLNIIFPTLKEQRQIGLFFDKIDNLIDLKSKKIISLERLKSGYLQKLFTDPYEDKPNLRFKGFDDLYNYKKLSDIANIKTGKLDANAMENNGKYDFYTSGVKVYKINEYAFNDEAITIAGNGANVGYMHLANGKFNAYQRTYVLNRLKINRIFLFYTIKNKIKKVIYDNSRNGNIPYIVISNLNDIIIKFPKSAEEQSKIANFMDLIDKQINLQQKELDSLKSLKKGYLQKMLV